MSSSSYASGTPLGSSSSPRDGNNNFMDGAENMLKLALKKPKAWKWELTTSSSSPGIDFPKIQLFDSRTGELMIQVDKPDCVVKSEQLEAGSERSRSSQGDGGKKSGKDQRYRRSRSSCIREKVATSGEYLSDVFEQLQNKGLGYKLATSASQYRVQEEEEEDRSLQKSKSANEVNGVKKKIRKSTSSRSSSILGRISEFYKSSTEEEPVVVSPPPPTPPPAIPEITVVEEPPAPEPPKNKIYKLVRSNAGTLIVREESFHTNRSLRRRKLESETTIPEDEPHTEQRVNLPVDIPTPSYDTTINEIDKLISKVMLSHTLQSVEEPPKHSSPVRIKQNEAKKRRSRRSASVGSAASRSASGGSRRGRKNSPRVTVLPGSSSSEEDAVSLAESRFGSLKRRGRPKYRRPAAVAAEENAVERSNGQETNAHQNQPQRTSSLRIEECSSTLSKSSSSGTSRSRSKSSSTSISTLSPPSDVGEPINAESAENPATHQAAIATLPEVHYERLNSIEQTAQVTEILNPRGSSSAPAPAPEPPRTRSKLHPDNFFNSYLAELRSLSAATSTISTELPRRNHLATSQSASSLVPPVKQQKQYGRRHHRSSYLQLLP
ncbi:uncharacterized protein LOC128092476 [Culex pipiens pallens]|uniref:uncharacterized protein LOC128092476 n=1 Tax=Culex pipiens pallens TaxID=42434 RepID=UPI0022AA388C|nr:uncharacterized protein LOC128092476 [Culex pipiens pallens]